MTQTEPTTGQARRDRVRKFLELANQDAPLATNPAGDTLSFDDVGPVRIPEDSAIVVEVVDACQAMPELYPILGARS